MWLQKFFALASVKSHHPLFDRLEHCVLNGGPANGGTDQHASDHLYFRTPPNPELLCLLSGSAQMPWWPRFSPQLDRDLLSFLVHQLRSTARLDADQISRWRRAHHGLVEFGPRKWHLVLLRIRLAHVASNSDHRLPK